MKFAGKLLMVLAVFALVAAACTFDIQPRETASAAVSEVLEFEVAENGLAFAFDEAPVYDDGYPQYGNPFITKGYIYPTGTLTCDADGVCNGVNDDGSPEFPNELMGTWYCRGFMIGDGAHTTGEPWTFTTQLYDLDPEPGAATIISNGYEHPDVGTTILRAVTGGTGEYVAAQGEVKQTLLGFNPTDGVAIQFAIELQ